MKVHVIPLEPIYLVRRGRLLQRLTPRPCAYFEIMRKYMTDSYIHQRLFCISYKLFDAGIEKNVGKSGFASY